MEAFFPEIQVIELSQTLAGKDLPQIPWVLDGDDSWHKGPPLFELRHESAPLGLRGWMAVSFRSVLFYVEAAGPSHRNTQTGYHIFDDDSVQIGIDARGDGAGGLPVDARHVGADDGWFGFALTDSGVQAWIYQLGEDLGTDWHGRPAPADWARIERDESADLTLYDIAIPWSALATPAGFSSDLGVCVQLNHGHHRERIVLRWGDTYSGNPQPAKMNKVRLQRPARGLTTWVVSRSEVWEHGDHGEIILSLWPDHPCRIKARLDKREREFTLHNGGAPETARRYAVRAFPASATGEPVPFAVSVYDSRGETIGHVESALTFPANEINALRARIGELQRKADHPLVQESLASIRRAVDREWARSTREALETGVPVWGIQTRAWARDFLEDMGDDMAQWESYVSRRRSLIVDFESTEGGAQRLYKVRLPRDYDPEREYPAFFILHGRGIRHSLQHVANDISPHEKNLYLGEDLSRDAEFFEFRIFVGELGYRGTGEDCFWDEVRDIHERFRVQLDRRYLIGGSMGGMGTWSLGMRTPDIWAAIAIHAGAPDYRQAGTDGPRDAEFGLGRNAIGLPVCVNHGADDLLVPVEKAREMVAELRRWGVEPRFDLHEGFGHGMPPGKFEETIRWMLGHQRRRPDSFAFVTDTNRYLGVWEIFLRRDPAVSPTPSFECRVEGDTLRIDSQGTEGLEVDLRALGIEGRVSVVWNGEKVYHGAANRVIQLGKGLG